MFCFYFAILLLIINSVETQQPCSTVDENPWIGKRFQVNPVPQPRIHRIVGGTMKMLDGCHFEVTNLTISPPCVGTYWYGVARGQKQGDTFPRIVEATVGSFAGQTAQFELKDVRWADMDGVYLYCENEGIRLSKTFWVPEKDDVEADSGSVTLGERWLELLVIVLALTLSQ
jgi:hypothetical protein